MKFAPLFLIALFSILFIGCVEPENSSEEFDSFTLTADAGDDKRVLINEPIVLKGKGTTTDNSSLSFHWEKGSETLSALSTFTYIPTKLGVDTLRFVVQHSDGSVISDTMKVVVIETKVVSRIPKLSPQLIKEYLSVINNARAKEHECGSNKIFSATTPLKWSEKLYKASFEHTNDLVKSQTFAHDGSGTESDWTGYVLGKQSSLQERVETYNYNWKYIGENIGAGTVIDSAEKMVKGWLKSPNHCVNLMNPNYTEVGMVMIKEEGSLYTHYWTQDFGQPK